MSLNLLSELPSELLDIPISSATLGLPSSYASIPRIIRHKEENVGVFGFALLGDYLNLGEAKGTLYISPANITWFSAELDRGFSISYQCMIMHGVSRAGGSPADNSPSIYMQLDINELLNSNGDSVLVEHEDELVAEMKLFPVDEKAVDEIFLAISECMAFHPDSEAENDGEIEQEADGDLSDEARKNIEKFERLLDEQEDETVFEE